MASALRRIEVGFDGGQVLALRISDEELASLREALQRGGWHRLASDEAEIELFLDKLVFIKTAGDGHVELLSPLGDDTPVGKFLAKKGPGLHHVAYAVSDIEATLAELSEAGVQLIDETPRIGIRGSRVAFCHPKSTGGVLTEIVEPAEAH